MPLQFLNLHAAQQHILYKQNAFICHVSFVEPRHAVQSPPLVSLCQNRPVIEVQDKAVFLTAGVVL